MSQHNDALDPDFIQKQKQRLEELQAELQSSLDFRLEDELQMQETRTNQARTSGSDAQKSAQQDNNRAVRAHDRMRLEAVRRALEKIEEGTYGQSEQSGDPIPRARLEAAPSALYTVAEEEVREREQDV
ncbi:TraR/DksA family transcriptional regulator [Lysobacter sp. H23M47]|uniref:TraR/DksA family transcriptional regulator n=1 Tax=Lysobacter sp. H23M47 TaxID=2781024 RepID=UPI00187F2657|nr:TraR/DksA family transcriptional regulator [Lysobacter sp. H23M47]QOW24522.1 TraR/DksA family transcriptional regulator [Lysobacter sp. H23M47]